MKLLPSSSDIHVQLTTSFARCDSCQIAVAWGAVGFELFEQLDKFRSKIKRLVVGTHFYQTHPDFIEAFRNHPNVKFVKPTDGVFHPKAYLFESKGNFEVVVGSANLTRGGMETNNEIAIFVESSDLGCNEVVSDLLTNIDTAWSNASVFSPSELAVYRNAWKRNRQSLKRLSGKFGGSSDTGTTDRGKQPEEIEILGKDWATYFAEVSSEKDHHDVVGRTRLMDGVRALFNTGLTFAEMELSARLRIAGLVEDFEGVNYLWFGSMKGAGKFWKAINDNEEHLSHALDRIPLVGSIERDDYLAFIDAYVKAFPEGRHGIGTATRLLAMKRPDVFVCLDARNLSALCKAFGITQNVDYEKYWDSIVERIMQAQWWLSPVPDSKLERKVWSARAAFLDAIFYDGKGL